MTEELMTDENPDEPTKNKKPIPRDMSGVGYITKDDFVRSCKTGIGIPLPDDFKEWENPIFNKFN